MKIPKKYRPELIVSQDKTRPVLNNVEIREIEGQPMAVATDGRKLVAVPVEAEKSEYGQLPPTALKFARQAMASKKQDHVVLEVSEKTVTFENGWSMPRQEQHDFPSLREILEKKPVKLRISFNAEFLAQMAKAFGTDNVILEFPEREMDPITVKSPHDKAFGVLMPVRIA